MHIGPYDIEGTLGEGGMGVVYRARNRDTGQTAAVKTVRLPRPSGLASLRREIQRLERLRHPGVVRVLDHGVQEGLPWYAMELLEGATWRQRFPRRSSSAPDGLRPSIAISDPAHGDAVTRDGWGKEPSPRGEPPVGEPITDDEIPELCRVTRRLCDALGYIHGEGVVHRDLKPENVLLRPGGEPTLLDFGLVVEHSGAAGREVLDVEAILAGTAAFMAPEQIFGELVDARADVFALGCMLYESMTGRLPFPQNLHDRKLCWGLSPPAPSRFAPAVPPALDQLVLEMLKHDPRDRIGHASDVAAALDRYLGVQASAAAPAYVYRSRFAGRGEALEALTARVSALKERRGGRVLVEGESGSGKTRLVLEAVRRAGTETLNMIGCECAPFDAGGSDDRAVSLPPLSPLKPLLRMVADRCRTAGADATRRLLGARLPILRALEPSLATVPGADEQPEPPPLPPEAAKHRVLEAMTGTLRALAADAPVMLLVDDLQWADNLTLELVAHLDAADVGPGVLVIATCRSEARPPAIDALAGVADVQRIVLQRLDESTIGVLIADILAVKSPPPELVRFIAERAEGNPFFVNEYLRTAVAEGVLRRTADARWALAGDPTDNDGNVGWAAKLAALGLPRTLREIVARRLAELDGGLRELVVIAAVLGREFDPELLARLCGLDERAFSDALNELSRRNVLGPSTGSRYRFTHDKLREGAAESIPPARKQALHRAVAEAYEARGVEPEELATLAHHWAHADQADKARVYLRLAGEQALQAGAHQEAAPLFARAIELADKKAAPLSPDGPARLHQRHADALWGLGDTRRGASEAEAALALMGVRVPRSSAGATVALMRQLVEQLARVAFSRRPSPSDDELALARAESAVRLMQCAFAAQRPAAQALWANLLAANLAERAGVRGPKSVPFAHLGAVAGMMRLEKLAQRYFARARADAEARHDPAAFAEAGIMEASHYYSTARWDALDATSARDIAVAESVGDRPAWEGLMLVTGGAALLRGRLDDAATRLEEVRRSASARAGHYMNAWATTLLALHKLWRRDSDGALELATAARRDFREDGGVAVANATAVQAAAHVLRGERQEALVAADETLALLEKGPLMYFMWPACDATASALAELWQQARDRDEAAPVRQRALIACRFSRALGARSVIGKPIALRAAAAAALLDGRAARARSLYAKARDRARALLLPIVEAQVGHESASLEGDEGGHR